MAEATLGDDQAQRTRALDIARSFIVQAPAGSGKTGLLIQRYLALLAHVERPEAIVAMTFTRKAAGEIRQRIIAALRLAESEAVPDDTHEALTWRLARAARERDAALGWQLIAHPARLQVHTIDAFCAALMRQAPLTAKLGAMPRFVERAQSLYVDAARAALSAADAADASWQCLLEHLDNDADRLVALIAELLERREQWLRHLVGDDPQALRAVWERALVAEIERGLAIARAAVPPHLVASLLELMRFAAGNLATDADHALALCAACKELPPSATTALDPWRALCDWLLTRNGEFRRKLGKSQGFPAKGRASAAGHAEREARRQSMLALLGELAAVPGLAAALDVVRRLPPPAYDDQAWSFIAALLEVLPKVVARLQLVFAEAGSIDFAEATLVALRALDSAERPSDLLLALDMRIEHLLIDEFQDTSIAQCELIERLTEGWQPGDGRTLFLVGDPMQSIYRFREAEVGLFLAARQRRALGGIALEPLTLSRNFRSQRCLVDWVNRIFPAVLRPVDDPARGAVAFKAAVAARDPLSEPAVTLNLCADAEHEARVIVERIEAALEEHGGSIAVLVRKRTDLEALLPALRSAGIAFAAVDLDRLSERQAILDLASLTHALTQPDDRLAWFASLRAPWCGLTLPDLFAVARASGPGSPWNALATHASGAEIAGLSCDGNVRLARFLAVVAPALEARGRTPLTTMVRGAWLALGGPATVAEAIDLSAAERFFALLAEHASGAEVPDWTAFTDALDNLYAGPDSTTTARVLIMTLHRAKGLEFDTVLLPGLARRPKRSDPALLRWRQRPHGLLLAPIKARATRQGEDDPVYAYLRALEADEEDAELARLLYVGCTRARQRLHLSAVLDVQRRPGEPLRWKAPVRGTALASLWLSLAGDVEPPLDGARPPLQPPPTGGVPLQRLRLDWRVPDPPAAVPVAVRAETPPAREAIEFDWARETAKHIGTVAHRLLRQIALEGLERWSKERLAGERPRVEIELGSLGVSGLDAARAADDVLASIATTLADPRGRWLFDSGHTDAASESALTTVRDDALVNIVLDRTFVDAEGTRWIIDFKLSRHAGGDVVAFLDNERERYREQLERYATVMRAIDSRPIRLGLYFPLLGGWREWVAPV